MAPCARSSHSPSKVTIEAASKINLIEFALVHELHLYNWFAPMHLATGALDAFCDLLPDLCKEFAHKFLGNDEVDNAARFDVFMSNEPSGSSYRTFVWEC